MQKISAVINTRNEEQNIRYCLETLKWCDEIIVVDMESDDKTVEIVREYTDKIYNHEIVQAFDSARKFAVEKATGDWILLIDADELVPKSLCDRLKDIAINDEADIVYIPFKTYIMGEWIKNTGWWPDYHPRFFRRGTINFVETIHAYMNESSDAKRLYLPPDEINSIEHFAYKDITQFIKKLNKYTTIEASHLYNNKIKFSCYTLLWKGINEFIIRYLRLKGYKDGYRGFFLSLIMCIYRVISYIKLWEMYENEGEKVSDKYIKYKNGLINKHNEHN